MPCQSRKLKSFLARRRRIPSQTRFALTVTLIASEQHLGSQRHAQGSSNNNTMAAPPMNEYELQRQIRLEANHKRMEEMGLFRQKSILESFAPSRHRGGPDGKAPKPPKQPRLARSRHRDEPRRSKRVLGEKIDYCEIGDNDRVVRSSSTAAEQNGHCHDHHCGEYHELLDLMDRGRQSTDEAVPAERVEQQQEMQERLQQMRCSSQGRGSVYDSSIGITCHFCRQKKLCGEPDCPRCQHRDSTKDCIGKTECSKCHSAFGKFCRACLLIRYGQTLEEATKEMEAGTWLCPHCYEAEHPEEGWICNSSICMKRRGLRPTGIAIYTAMEQGYKSVAHLLQVELQKKGGVGKLQEAAEAAAGTQGQQRQGTGAEAAAAPETLDCGTGQGQQQVEAGPEAAAPEATAGTDAGAAAGPRGRGRPRKTPAAGAEEAVAHAGVEAACGAGSGGRGVKRGGREALEEVQPSCPRRSLRTRS